jgi:chromosome partitioning protein
MDHLSHFLGKGLLMGKIIAVGNLKGGTGKSTIAVNLACRLAEKERAVVLIDADPQGTAAAWLRDGTPPGLCIVSGPLACATGDGMWTEQISEQRSNYDRIVIDLPPQTGASFEAALRIADLLIVPLTLSEVDLHATAQALAVLHRMRAVRAGRPACLLVPSKVDRRTSLGRRARASLATLGWQVGPALGQRAAHSDAFKAARWIGAHAPGTAAHMEVRMLVEEVEDQLARCLEAEENPRPAHGHADAPMPAPAGLQSRPGAPPRIAALCLGLVAAMLSKLRRAEQQALY